MQDWRWWTASDLGRGIGAGSVDPVALAEVYLDAITTHEHGARIYARVTPDRARAEARAAARRAASGLRRGPLDGVPVSWKDNIDSAGVPTEAGTALMAGRTPARDAAVLEAGTAAGLVCLGKTHLSEIAFSGLGLNPVTATPPNVHDAGAVAGGSSSGAAASVAFGLAAAAIGTDTGGSVRIPSAWNDLTGFKPTQGAVDMAGVIPLCEGFDVAGPLARSVEDAALLFAALRGQSPADLRGGTLDGARLLSLRTVARDALVPAAEAAQVAAEARLAAAGAVIVPFDFPDLTEAFALAGTLYGAEAYGWWRDHVEAAPEKMFPRILDRVRGGREVLASDYLAAWRRLHEIRAAFRAATAGAEAVIWPAAPILPPQAQRLLDDPEHYVEQNLLALRNTRIANLLELPSITLPTGAASCGVLLNGHPGQEARLLRLARAAEAALA